jgi:hypothetical protein
MINFATAPRNSIFQVKKSILFEKQFFSSEKENHESRTATTFANHLSPFLERTSGICHFAKKNAPKSKK